jgi:proteasomal ATPase-associated factor 1
MIAGNGRYVPVSSMSLGERGEGKVWMTQPDGESFTENSESRSESGDNQGTKALADEGEVDTSDKVVFCALSNGSFEAFDLRSKAAIFQSAPVIDSTGKSSALSSIIYSSSHQLVATGSVNGTVVLFDVRSLSTPLTSFYRNTACIEDLVFCNPQGSLPRFLAEDNRGDIGLIVATEDGLPFIAAVLPDGLAVRAELVGSDCDAVRAVRTDQNGVVWTAADDGIVRRY